jgi:putative ABC transport system ATP-binding protein
MIQFEKISLKFDEKQIFSDFSLEIKEKDKVWLKAPSGKGKTTLFRTLMGYQKIDSGVIKFDGKPLNRQVLCCLRKQIAYVSQDVDFRPINVWESIEEIFSYKVNVKQKVSREIFLNLAQQYYLEKDILDKKSFELSGGERRRLGFVIAILLDRPIWLLDEVTAGLDRDTKKKIMTQVMTADKTVLMISHDEDWTEYNELKEVTW